MNNLPPVDATPHTAQRDNHALSSSSSRQTSSYHLTATLPYIGLRRQIYRSMLPKSHCEDTAAEATKFSLTPRKVSRKRSTVLQQESRNLELRVDGIARFTWIGDNSHLGKPYRDREGEVPPGRRAGGRRSTDRRCTAYPFIAPAIMPEMKRFDESRNARIIGSTASDAAVMSTPTSYPRSGSPISCTRVSGSV